MFIVILFQTNFYENSIRIIGKILENNWGEILEFQSRIIGRKKRIMCRPLSGAAERDIPDSGNYGGPTLISAVGTDFNPDTAYRPRACAGVE